MLAHIIDKHEQTSLEHQENPIPSTSKSEADFGPQSEMASKCGSPAIVEEPEEWGVARPSIELATTQEEVREAYAEADRNWDRLLAYVGTSREEFDNDCEDQNKENDGIDDSGERDWGSNIGIYGDGGDDEDEGEVDRDEDGEKVNSDRARDVNESKGLLGLELGLEQGKEERREKGWLRKLKFWKR